MTFLDEFDWDAYSTSSGSRFINNDFRAFSSSGVENSLFLFSLTILFYWLYRIIKQLYSILISTKYLQIHQRAIHLNGMSRWVDELKRLKKSHFNQILRIKRPISPIFLPRVRLLVDFKPKTVKIVTDDSGASAVEFKFDCKRTCFLTAHWGIPLDVLDSVVNPAESHYSITIGDEVYAQPPDSGLLSLFFRAFLPGYNDRQSLLVTEADSSSECSSGSKKFGDITLLSSNRNMDVSSEPICFNPGKDHTVRLKPSNLTLDQIAQATSNNGGLLASDKIIALVVVLYVPKDHETTKFTSGNIETYNSYAQVTSVNITQKTFRIKRLDIDPQLICDVDRQIVFSSGIGPHEPKDMFGMGYRNDKECLICLAREMDTVLLPCCHSSFCSSCIRSLRQEKCPICRTNFASYVCFNLAPA